VSAPAKRFNDILTLLTQFLGDGKRKKIQAHEAIHLTLLVDSLFDDYTRSWAASLAGAFDEFRANLATDTKDRFARQGDHWTRYGQFARTNSDRAEVILRRHEFFAEKMYAALSPKIKDPNRNFGLLEREIIYYPDGKRCQVCGNEVAWADAEIHHVEEHAKGGLTVLPNGALVCKHCHPKGTKQTADFAVKWKAKHAPTKLDR